MTLLNSKMVSPYWASLSPSFFYLSLLTFHLTADNIVGLVNSGTLSKTPKLLGKLEKNTKSGKYTVFLNSPSVWVAFLFSADFLCPFSLFWSVFIVKLAWQIDLGSLNPVPPKLPSPRRHSYPEAHLLSSRGFIPKLQERATVWDAKPLIGWQRYKWAGVGEYWWIID